MSTKEVVKYRDGKVKVAGVSAQAVASEIQRIEEKYGSVKPETLVKENSNPSKPLYNYFEWDNEGAGEKYRLIQARYLLRSIVIEKPVEGTNQTVSVNLMFSAQTEKGSAYFSLAKIATRDDLFMSALSKLRAHAESVANSVNELQVLAPKPKQKIMKRMKKPVEEIKKISEELGA